MLAPFPLHFIMVMIIVIWPNFHKSAHRKIDSFSPNIFSSYLFLPLWFQFHSLELCFCAHTSHRPSPTFEFSVCNGFPRLAFSSTIIIRIIIVLFFWWRSCCKTATQTCCLCVCVGGITKKFTLFLYCIEWASHVSLWALFSTVRSSWWWGLVSDL